MRFTPSYWQRTYNLQPEDIATESAPSAPTEFSEPAIQPLFDQHALDEAIAGLASAELQQQAEQTLLPIIEALQKGRDETEVLGLLAETRPDLDATALREQLARLLFISNVWGRLSAAADRVDE
ncbi:hypothetical protein D3C78_1415680 [compost metagenome]